MKTNTIKITKPFEAGPLSGWIEREEKLLTPQVRYAGPKIPFELWEQVLSWFAANHKGEVSVRLYTDWTRWAAVPFPQEYPTGLFVKELGDHPACAGLHQSLAGWVHYGSVHHHKEISAFQSGTDHADEVKTAGIHLTVGHLGSAHYDIHARVCVKVMGELGADGTALSAATQAFFEPNLAEWFDVPEVAQGLAPGMHKPIIEYYLGVPAAGGYPSEWDTRLVAPAPVSRHTDFSGFGSTYPHPAGKGYSKGKYSTFLGGMGTEEFPDYTPTAPSREGNAAAFAEECEGIEMYDAREIACILRGDTVDINCVRGAMEAAQRHNLSDDEAAEVLMGLDGYVSTAENISQEVSKQLTTEDQYE